MIATYWGSMRLVELPLHRLRFDPDPWGIGAEQLHARVCDCPYCRRMRKMLGPAAEAGAMVESELLAKTAALSQDTSSPNWPVAHAVEASPPATIAMPAAQQPLITAFDVHGSGVSRPTDLPEPPQGWPPDYRAERDNPFDVMAWIPHVVLGAAISLGAIADQVIRLILWRRA